MLGTPIAEASVALPARRRLPRLEAVLRFGLPVGILVVIGVSAILAPQVAPYDPLKFDIPHKLAGPSLAHPFGTDLFGRDVLSRLIFGARTTLVVSILGTMIALVVGAFVGVVSGYFGRWTILLMRLVDVLLAFPSLILAILVLTLLSPGVATLVGVIALVYTPDFARVSFAETLSARRLEHIEASKALGAGHIRLILGGIVPAVAPSLIVITSFRFGTAILTEAGLSFLGLGTPPPTPSWGYMVREAQNSMSVDPFYLVGPSLVISLTVLAWNVLGDGLRDRLDPRLRAI